jgi:hypothetical protein
MKELSVEDSEKDSTIAKTKCPDISLQRKVLGKIFSVGKTATLTARGGLRFAAVPYLTGCRPYQIHTGQRSQRCPVLVCGRASGKPPEAHPHPHHYLSEAHPEGVHFRSMLNYGKMLSYRENVFRRIGQRMMSVALENDTVIPPYEVINTL